MTETVDPPTMFYTVNDLSEGTRYKFVVAAKSNNGEGPRSIPVEVKTIDFSESYHTYDDDDDAMILRLLLIHFHVDPKYMFITLKNYI